MVRRGAGKIAALCVCAAAAPAVATGQDDQAAWKSISTVDAFTDAKTIGISARGENGSLVIACEPGSKQPLRLGITTDAFLGSYPRVRLLQTRFDDAPPIDAGWAYGDRTAFLYGEERAGFIDKIRRADRVRFRAVSGTMEAVDLDVKVTGASRALADLEAACAGPPPGSVP